MPQKKNSILHQCKNSHIISSYYRLTLLLGPPGSGKSTLLKALSGKTETGLNVKYTLQYLKDIKKNALIGYIECII